MFWKVIGVGIGLLLGFGGIYVICKGKGLDRPIGCGMVGIGFLLLPKGQEPIIGIMLSVLFIAAAIIWGVVYSKNEANGVNEKKRALEQTEIQNEYKAALASQEPGEPWRIRYATDPCPYCGHYKVRNAKWEDKQLSIAFWGIASDKIGKSFKCEHCGEMW